jgi:TPR repeat protein
MMDGIQSENPKGFSALSEALRGSVSSQYELAMMLEEQSDIELACAWYQKAAMQGHTGAAFRCGMLCLKAKGERQKEASYWLTMAANNGYPEAQYNLALIHEKGLGGAKIDPDEALKWHRIAARLGHAEARAKLDSMDSWLLH